MKQSFQFLFLTTFTLLFLLSACKKENEINSLQGVIDNAGGFGAVKNSTEVVATETSSVEIDGALWECTTETQSVNQGGGGTQGFPLFNPNAGIIFPGNLLQGESLKNATPSTITVERAGGKISTDVVDGNLVSSFEVNSVTKSEVTNAINNIIANSTGVVPANFEFDYENVQSREQFALELGLDIGTAFSEFESKVSFSSDKEYNRYYVSLNQSYYTMSFDEPTSPDQVFGEGVTPDDLAKYTGDGNPITYISDVTYGRIYYMLIESTSSVTEMDAQIEASFSGVTNTVDGSIDASYLSDLSDLKIQVFAFGGNSVQTLQTIGETNLNALVGLLTESSDITTGKPISYVVKSLYDNQIVSVQLATEYDVTNCEPVGADGAPPFTAHWTGNVLDQMGPVGAAYAKDNEIILISKEGTEWLRSRPGILEGPFDIDDLGTSSCPLQGGIGAACNTKVSQEGEFQLLAVDKLGLNFAYMDAAGNWGEVQSIYNLGGNNNPFNVSGIGSVSFVFLDDNGTTWLLIVNNEGDHCAYYLDVSDDFTNVIEVEDLGSVNVNYPMNDVGAVASLVVGNLLFSVYFDKSGTQYSAFGSFDGGSHDFTTPFDL